MIGGALQKAIFTALTASPAVAGGRIYDQVPKGAVFPYVTIGDEQVIDDSNGCSDAWEAFADVHVWSRPATGSKIEAKDLAASIVTRLSTELPVAGFVTILGTLQTMRTFRDPDGLTEHAVLTFRYLIDPV